MRNWTFATTFLLYFTPVVTMAATSGASHSSTLSGSDQFYLGVSLAPVVSMANDSVHALGGSFPTEGTVATSSTYGYDARLTLGPIFFHHLLMGFTYNYLADETHRPSSASGDTTKNEHVMQREFGPTMGLLFEHWQFKATWLISSVKNDSDSEANPNGTAAVSTSTKNYDGHGWQVELGYAFQIYENFSIGPSIVYRRVQYGLQSYSDAITPGNSYNGKAFADKADNGSVEPMLLMAVKF